MTKSSPTHLKKELAALPIARIETMDVSYVLLLREYLFTNGCQVFVNTGPTENVTYFFLVGDSNFVKKTLAFRHNLGKKQCILCWDQEDHESIEQFLDIHSKIVYINPVPLTPDILSEIFTFLFTTKGKELNMQSSQIKSSRLKQFYDDGLNRSSLMNIEIEENEPMIPPSSHMYEEVQKNRIAKVISDTFERKHKKPVETPLNGDQTRPVSPLSPFTGFQSFLSRKLGIAIILCILFIAPFFFYGISFSIRVWSLLNAASCFKNGKSDCVAVNIKKERLWSGYNQLTMPFVHTALRFPLGEKTVQAFERLDRLCDIIADVEDELLFVNDDVLSIGSSLFLNQKEKQSLSPVVAVDTIKKKVPSIRNKLDIAASYVQSLQTEKVFPFSIPFVQKQIEKAGLKLDKFREIAQMGQRLSQLYPFVAGFRDKERILVILQNTSELRPTGGFIGSLAHLTISEGVLEEIRIEDVYALDGQLKGHIDPPTPLKELLGQEHWYLRDSNWNPDFRKTGEQVRFFYEKETGEHIDSVIGITSSFIVRLLRIIGPVDIPLYNDRITADNFYLKSLYYTQANFFPGSSQKKDFLGALTEALLVKVQKQPQSGIAIMEGVHDSLISRDIQWYTTNPDGQETIEQFGWGGTVPAGTACLSLEHQPPCLFSYFFINEANLSVNKVNTFIDRTQSRSIRISESGDISETIMRKLQNLSQGESGTGAYTTYLRIFFPSNVTLTNLTLDGKPVPMKDPKNKRTDLPYGELDLSLPNVTGIGIAFEVAPGRERIISASVSHTTSFLTQNKEELLTLFEQKQAGVDQVPITTSITYPPTWDAHPFPSTDTERMVAKPGYLEYNTILSKDSEVSIRFVR